MKQKRFKRKDISGAKGWEVNAAGHVYCWRDKQEVTNVLAGLPSIDMGPHYKGPAPRSGLLQRSAEVSKELHQRHRLLEEIVAIAFLGAPCKNWAITMRVGHSDGNDWNCAAANLYWTHLDEYDDDAEFLRYVWLMRRPNHSGKGAEARRTLPSKTPSMLFFSTALNLPGLLPTPSKGHS
jgi:hypothetical protein